MMDQKDQRCLDTELTFCGEFIYDKTEFRMHQTLASNVFRIVTGRN